VRTGKTIILAIAGVVGFTGASWGFGLTLGQNPYTEGPYYSNNSPTSTRTASGSGSGSTTKAAAAPCGECVSAVERKFRGTDGQQIKISCSDVPDRVVT
jgi:hypothetical protein